jgi:hypothetical protein
MLLDLAKDVVHLVHYDSSMYISLPHLQTVVNIHKYPDLDSPIVHPVVMAVECAFLSFELLRPMQVEHTLDLVCLAHLNHDDVMKVQFSDLQGILVAILDMEPC